MFQTIIPFLTVPCSQAFVCVFAESFYLSESALSVKNIGVYICHFVENY